MNTYDSDKMVDILHASHALELTQRPEKADVILLNTCSIREKAQEKVFSELGRFRKLKEKNPHLVIGIGGCVASQEGEEILKRVPFVDIVFGPQTLHRLPALLKKFIQYKKPCIDISFPAIEKFDQLPMPKNRTRTKNITAYVSIMEGCSKYCSFCVVPYTRGEEISRPVDDVIAEIVHLSEQGAREIILLGQNVNDYRGLMHDGHIADLALLIHYVAAIDEIQRIRFITSHPLAFSDNLIEAFAEVPKLANFLHLPVQSGSDRILAAMKRGYTALEFKSKIKKLRKVRPNISLSSDFIVGFPGETHQDFQATMDLIHTIGFDHSYSFIYSKRPGTPAAQLSDDVLLETKKQRLAILQSRIKSQAIRISESMLGSTQFILVTGFSQKVASNLIGFSENNRLVRFKGNKNLIGQIVPIKITKISLNALEGVWLGRK